ncbi:MAG: hypothetical protein ACRCX2_20245 [Paraclostridium sp.]
MLTTFELADKIVKDSRNRKQIAALEELSLEELWSEFSTSCKSYETWVAADKMNLYEALGLESAYISDRSIFKNAWIRFKAAFSLDNDKAMVEYLNVFRNLSIERITPGSSELLLTKENVLAYDKLMDLMSSLETTEITSEVSSMLRHLEGELRDTVKKYLIAFLVCGLPIVNIIVAIWAIITERSLVNLATDTNTQYGDRLIKLLSSVVANSSMAKELNIKINKEGVLDISDVSKIVSNINKTKNIMLPSAVRNSIRPNWLKTRTFVSYEDKKFITSLVIKNTEKYLSAMGNTPAAKSNAIKFILSAEKFSNQYQYGMDFDNNVNIESAFGSLATSMFLAFIDTTTVGMMLAQDFKKY